MNMKKIYWKTRAVSPVIAAILLIGLAVLAGAAVAFIVLPLIEGNADIQFQSISGSDSNSDGLVDKITMTFVNTGTTAGTISQIDTTGMNGWSVTTPSGGTIEIAASAAGGEDIVIATSDVRAQLTASDSISVDIFIDNAATPSFSIDSTTAAEDGTTYANAISVKSVGSADLKISDYDDTNWGLSATANGQQVFFDNDDANRQASGGSPGVWYRTDNGAPGTYLFESTAADGSGIGTFSDTSATTTWDRSQNTNINFYMKLDRVFTAGTLRVYFGAYSGTTRLGDFYHELGQYFDGDATDFDADQAYVANTWVLISLDFTDTALWAGYATEEQSATTVGGFAIYWDNNQVNDMDAYIDDIYLTTGL